jgi:hypothetical protein
MSAFYKEDLLDVVWDAREELYCDRFAFSCKYFSCHWTAFNKSRSSKSAQVDVKTERYS